MDKLKVTGSLRTYLQWPFAVTVIWAVMVVLLFLYGGLIPGLIGLGFLILYFGNDLNVGMMLIKNILNSLHVSSRTYKTMGNEVYIFFNC